MSLKNLSLLTGFLFIVSLLVYFNENRRGTDLLSGSYYIAGLDIEKIQRIVVDPKGDDNTITLVRQGERFVLDSHKSYPVAMDKINAFLYRVANIEVREKVVDNADDDDLKTYELDESSMRYLVEFFDGEGNEVISFRVGKSYRTGGNYLFKKGETEIYLSENALMMEPSYREFVDTMLFNIEKEDVERVQFDNIREVILAQNGTFTAQGPRGKRFKKEKMEEFVGGLSNARFEDFFTPADSDVQALTFERNLTVHLKGGLIYRIALAQKESDHFARIQAMVDEMPEKEANNAGDREENLQNIERIIEAQTNAQRINREKSSWVYKINESLYEKLAKNFRFFI